METLTEKQEKTFSRATLLIGARWLADQMDAVIAELRQEIARLEEMGSAAPTRRKTVPSNRYGCAGMSAEERSTEMKRRLRVAKRNKARQKPGPKTEAGRSALSEVRRKEWAKMSPRARKARLAAMAAGKARRRVNNAIQENAA
jgi:hypothetical protein